MEGHDDDVDRNKRGINVYIRRMEIYIFRLHVRPVNREGRLSAMQGEGEKSKQEVG